MICMTIPLNKLLTSDQFRIALYFGQDGPGMVKPTQAHVIVEMPFAMHTTDVWAHGEENTIWRTDILIKNSGVYDLSAFPPCIKELDTFGGNCYHFQLIQKLVEKCRCFPTSYPMGFHEKTYADRALPWCSTEHYSNCDSNWKNHTLVDCKPCKTVKNDYIFRNEILHNQSVTRIGFAFRYQEHAYSYFQDKKQHELVNVIAQVGGFLAVCIGFNLLRGVKFLLFFKPKRKLENAQKRSQAKIRAGIIFYNFVRMIPCASDDDPVAAFTQENREQMSSLRERLEIDIAELRGEVEKLRSEISNK